MLRVEVLGVVKDHEQPTRKMFHVEHNKPVTDMTTTAANLPRTTCEYRLVPLHDAPPPNQMTIGDTPEKIAAYWRANVQTSVTFSPTVENAVVIFLNTRRRITGHLHLATGTLDTLLIHPREVFRAAILANAAAIVIGHQHPSGDSTPSEADIKVTRDLIRAGQLLKIDILDHVVIGHPAEGKGFSSLRELGFFYQ
jgi:DNA repair protein RadC